MFGGLLPKPSEPGQDPRRAGMGRFSGPAEWPTRPGARAGPGGGQTPSSRSWSVRGASPCVGSACAADLCARHSVCLRSCGHTAQLARARDLARRDAWLVLELLCTELLVVAVLARLVQELITHGQPLPRVKPNCFIRRDTFERSMPSSLAALRTPICSTAATSGTVSSSSSRLPGQS